MMKRLCILGSTGSIGTQTLEVVRGNRSEFQVTALTAGDNITLLAEQIAEFHPQIVAVKSGEGGWYDRTAAGDQSNRKEKRHCTCK